MTNGTNEPSHPGGWRASHARRVTLLSWLLVVSLVVFAEFAWVLWLQNIWTMTSTGASLGPRPLVSPSERSVPWAANSER